jgi:hypothetical protein
VRLHNGVPLSTLQQRFLEERDLKALLGLSRGVLTSDEFRSKAEAEQKARIAASTATKEQEDESTRSRQEATDRKNAELFAARERKRAQRKLFDDFGLGYVEPDHFSRVRRILRQVSNGTEIQNADLIWLAGAGHEYWTDELRRAQHKILAERFALEWRESGDPWKAVNACSQLSVAGEALVKDRSQKVRSALLTTSGGALRDLGRHQQVLKHGTEAHALCPDDYRPCTLLGAGHIEMHAYAEGADWYEKAEARGASRNLVDQEIRALLAAARPEERETIRRAFKAHDAVRFELL